MIFDQITLPNVPNPLVDRIRNKINLRAILTKERLSESMRDIDESIRALTNCLAEFPTNE